MDTSPPTTEEVAAPASIAMEPGLAPCAPPSAAKRRMDPADPAEPAPEPERNSIEPPFPCCASAATIETEPPLWPLPLLMETDPPVAPKDSPAIRETAAPEAPEDE